MAVNLRRNGGFRRLVWARIPVYSRFLSATTNFTVKNFCMLLPLVMLGFGSGCASIKLGDGKTRASRIQTESSQLQIERVVLREAVDRLSQTPWQKPEPVTFRMRIGQLFRDDTVKAPPRRGLEDFTNAYVHQLIRSPDPVYMLEENAASVLLNAADVAEAGRQAVEGARPLKSDVTLLETAISEIRLARAIIVGAEKSLARQGVAAFDRRDYFDAFSQTIADVSKAADLVAARAYSPAGIEIADKKPLAAHLQ